MSKKLFISLLERKAIPKHRLKWANDADFKIGSKRLLYEIMCENFYRCGLQKGKYDVFSHAHWFQLNKTLPFFLGIIYLPDGFIKEFKSMDLEDKSYENRKKLKALAKKI